MAFRVTGAFMGLVPLPVLGSGFRAERCGLRGGVRQCCNTFIADNSSSIPWKKDLLDTFPFRVKVQSEKNCTLKIVRDLSHTMSYTTYTKAVRPGHSESVKSKMRPTDYWTD